MTAQKNGYCVGHGKLFANSTTVTIAKPVKKVSDKRKEDNKELKKIVAAFLSKPENKYCKIRFAGCTNIADTAHHSEGRIGDNLLDVTKLIASCWNCNRVVEEQDALAREKGFKKSKFSPKEK